MSISFNILSLCLNQPHTLAFFFHSRPLIFPSSIFALGTTSDNRITTLDDFTAIQAVSFSTGGAVGMDDARAVLLKVHLFHPYISADFRCARCDHCKGFFAVRDSRVIGTIDRASAGESPNYTGLWDCCSALRQEEKSANESKHALRSVEMHLGLGWLLGSFEGEAGKGDQEFLED